jgi:hypothetical protein
MADVNIFFDSGASRCLIIARQTEDLSYFNALVVPGPVLDPFTTPVDEGHSFPNCNLPEIIALILILS